MFGQVFPEKPFERHIWNKALSDLNGCIADFLVVRQALTDPFVRLQANVNAYFTRTDKGLFKSAMRTAKDALNAFEGETVESWHLRFWLLKRELSYPYTDRMRNPERAYSDLEQYLDHYYLISKLQLACNRAAGASFQRLKNDLPIYRQLLDQTQVFDPAGKSAMLRLYCELLLLLTVPDAQFKTFFSLVKKTGLKLERIELESVVRLTLNYCIRRNREGEPDAFTWYRQLFDWATKQQVWAETTAEELFLNTGVMFAKSHDAAGFDTFLKKSKRMLRSERQEEAVALLQACWHFYQSEFDQAAKLLNTHVATRHPRFAWLFHSLQVRNCYEEFFRKQIDLSELERALSSFEGFLKRKVQFSDPMRQSYQTLVWFIRKMSQNGKKKSASKAKLFGALEQKQPAARDWLEAKIGELPR